MNNITEHDTRINEIAQSIRKLVAVHNQSLWDIGELLTQAHKAIAHGGWLSFLKTCNLSHDRASKAINFYQSVARPELNCELPLMVQYALTNQPKEIQDMAQALQVISTAALQLVVDAYHNEDKSDIQSMVATGGVYLGDDLIPFSEMKPSIVEAIKRERVSIRLGAIWVKYPAKGIVRMTETGYAIELQARPFLSDLMGREVDVQIMVKNESEAGK